MSKAKALPKTVKVYGAVRSMLLRRAEKLNKARAKAGKPAV